MTTLHWVIIRPSLMEAGREKIGHRGARRGECYPGHRVNWVVSISRGAQYVLNSNRK